VPNFTEESLQRIIINPFYAIALASQLTEEHEPAMDEAEWVRANASLMGEVGAARWLRQLLDVLGGDIVTAEEVGFTPLGGPFGYGAPGRSTARRRGKKQRNKRRRAEVGAYEATRPDGKQGDSTTPQKHTAVYVYATRQDPPGNLADQLITCLEQATKQENQRVATYVDIQPGYRYNLKDALAYAVHYVFEHGESISLARTFVRLLCSDRHINELLYELERHGIDPLSVLDSRIPQQEKIAHILREYAEQLGEQ
jgi:hypothetical protein